jgi:hypothetical protein
MSKKTIHIGNKRYPADEVPDKYKGLLPVPKVEKTPAKPAKSGN